MQKLTRLKSKIKSTENIKKITNAMEIISVTKLMRIEKIVNNIKIYQESIRDVVNNIIPDYELQNNSYFLKEISLTNVVILCIGSQKGLCGGFNNNLYGYLTDYISRSNINNFSLITVGKKGTSFFKNKKFNINMYFEKIDDAQLASLAKEIVDKILEIFPEDYQKIVVIYNGFKGRRLGRVVCLTLLPISHPEKNPELKSIYIYEPNAEEVINVLIPHYLWVSVYSCLVESRASEEVSRMLTMRQATDNANEMIDKLKLQYNRLRQTNITEELADVIGGYEAK